MIEFRNYWLPGKNMPHAVGELLYSRYRVQKLLGQGGFGAVYRAWDIHTNLPCAVKQNRESVHYPAHQFSQEANLLAKLHNPHLPRVTDHFTLPGQGQYLVMEYVEGEDLEYKLEKARHPLPEARVLDWADQILDAITYLHSQAPPIIHCDIKPSNIRITPQGLAVLVDFGLARIFDPTNKNTDGIRAVTTGYSPIEQYSSGWIDARTDIYALGATLYTLLTGQVVHESVLRYIVDPVKPPSQLNPGLSESTSFAIQRAISIDPRQRWQTAADFKAALHGQVSPEAKSGEESLDSPIEPLTVAAVVDPDSPDAVVLPGGKVQTNYPENPRSLAIMAITALLVICFIGALSGLFIIDPFHWLSGYAPGHQAVNAAFLATQTATASQSSAVAPSGAALDTLAAGSPAQAGNFRIGLLAPLSGAVPAYGISAKEGADLAVKEWNARGGLLGKKIEVVILDSRCEAGSSAEAANHLIFQEKVQYIIGEICTRASIPVSDIANQNRVVLISPVSTHPAITVDENGRTKPFVYRVPMIDAFQGRVMAKFAFSQGLRKAYIFTVSNNDNSQSLSQSFKEVFTSLGGQVVGQDTYPASLTDFSSMLDKVKSSQADVLFLPDYYPAINLIGRQAKALGVPAVLMGGDGWDSPELDLEAVEGSYFTNHFDPEDTRPALVKWMRRYGEEYNIKMPDAVAALTYDATNLLLAAIEKVGKDDPGMVAKTLAGMTWEGVSGNFHFDDQHNPIKSAPILGVRSGKRVFVTTVDP
jgi:branched-chain amino acid transport system substrate-binding protein